MKELNGEKRAAIVIARMKNQLMEESQWDPASFQARNIVNIMVYISYDNLW